MIQEEFLIKILEDLNVIQFSEEKRRAIEEYLTGKRNTLELPNTSTQLKYFVFSELQEAFETQHSEMARRAFYVASLLSPRQLIGHLNFWNTRYQTYGWARVDSQIVMRDVTVSLQNMLKNREDHLLANIQNEIKRCREGAKPSIIKDLFVGYEKEVKHYLEEVKQPIEENLLLRAFSVAAYEENRPLKEKAMHALEEGSLQLMGMIYTKQEVSCACSTFLGENLLEGKLQFTALVYTRYDKVKAEKLVLALCITFYKESFVLKELLKVQLLLKGGYYCEEMLEGIARGKANEALASLVEELQIPYLFRICYYSEKMLIDPFYQKGSWYEEKLRSIYNEDSTLFIKAFDYLKSIQNPGAVTLYALLRKYGATLKEDALLSLEALLPAITQVGSQDTQAALALYEVSEVARKEIAEVIRTLSKRQVLSNFASAGSLFYTKSYENILSPLADYVGVKPVIIAGVEADTNLPKNVFVDFIKAHIEEANEVFVEKLEEGNHTILSYVRLMYQEELGMDYKNLARVMFHRLKTVINFMEDYLKGKEDQVRVHLESLQKTKNKNAEEAVQRLLKKWDAKKYEEKLSAIENIEEVTRYIQSLYGERNDKFIPFKDEIDLSSVKDREGKRVDEVLLKYYISEYMCLKEVYIIKACELIKDFFNPNTFNQLIKNIYKIWLRSGADTKQKNVVLLYALNAEGEELTQLKKQIDAWTEHARGALAAFAVTALAMNGSSLALMLTDGIAQKYKNKQVRAAASEALGYVAQVRGVSKETLGDKIVPTLGFDANREICFDYGARSFKGILSPKLEVILFDENGKAIKNLPGIVAKDDRELAERAKETLKGLKKQVKAIVSTQKLRLEKAMMTGRCWTKEDWTKLFIENPIMNGFATSLIWAEYDKARNIMGTFRYMEDGTFNTVDEEEYSLKEDTVITLVHPLELGKEVIAAWKNQLVDYEVIQSITQLDVPVYTLMPEEEEAEPAITRFMNKKVYFGTILGIMDKYDWKKTSIGDGGGYEGYYYEDQASGVGVKLNLDFVYVGMQADEEVKLQEMEFYKYGSINFESYCDDTITDQKRVWPRDVPEKFLSLALMVGELIAVKSI